MSIIYNGTTIDKIYYGNAELQSVLYNNIAIFSSTKPYEDFLDASSISESNFLTKVCIPDTFDDINPSTNLPYANNFIGKEISLVYMGPDMRDSTGNTPMGTAPFKILGYNWDDSEYTFDMWPLAPLRQTNVGKYTDLKSANSDLNIFVGFLSNDIRSRINHAINERHSTYGNGNLAAKHPSLIELGYTDLFSDTSAGADWYVDFTYPTKYPQFPEKTSNTTNSSVRYKYYNNMYLNTLNYITRTKVRRSGHTGDKTYYFVSDTVNYSANVQYGSVRPILNVHINPD